MVFTSFRPFPTAISAKEMIQQVKNTADRHIQGVGILTAFQNIPGYFLRLRTPFLRNGFLQKALFFLAQHIFRFEIRGKFKYPSPTVHQPLIDCIHCFLVCFRTVSNLCMGQAHPYGHFTESQDSHPIQKMFQAFQDLPALSEQQQYIFLKTFKVKPLPRKFLFQL